MCTTVIVGDFLRIELLNLLSDVTEGTEILLSWHMGRADRVAWVLILFLWIHLLNTYSSLPIYSISDRFPGTHEHGEKP